MLKHLERGIKSLSVEKKSLEIDARRCSVQWCCKSKDLADWLAFLKNILLESFSWLDRGSWVVPEVSPEVLEVLDSNFWFFPWVSNLMHGIKREQNVKELFLNRCAKKSWEDVPVILKCFFSFFEENPQDKRFEHFRDFLLEQVDRWSNPKTKEELLLFQQGIDFLACFKEKNKDDSWDQWGKQIDALVQSSQKIDIQLLDRYGQSLFTKDKQRFLKAFQPLIAK